MSEVALGDDGYVKAIKTPRRRGRARSCRVQRTQPARRLPDQRSASMAPSTFKLQEVSRHRSVDVLAGYVRRSDLFKGHAGAGFL